MHPRSWGHRVGSPKIHRPPGLETPPGGTVVPSVFVSSDREEHRLESGATRRATLLWSYAAPKDQSIRTSREVGSAPHPRSIGHKWRGGNTRLLPRIGLLSPIRGP